MNAPQHLVEIAEFLSSSGFCDVVGVPDSQLGQFLAILESRNIAVRYVFREDTAVAVAAGSVLAGRPTAVFMKNAGIGTSMDAIISLGFGAGIDLVVIVGASGTGSDNLSHHEITGVRTRPILDALGVSTVDVSLDDPTSAHQLTLARAAAAADKRPFCVLVRP